MFHIVTTKRWWYSLALGALAVLILSAFFMIAQPAHAELPVGTTSGILSPNQPQLTTTDTPTITPTPNCGLVWRVASSPNPGDGDKRLNGLVAVSTDDVWAVGDYGSSALTEHWDGSQWSIIPSAPNTNSSSSLKAVAAISSTDVWAVGNQSGASLVEHWDGVQWTAFSSPSPGDYDNILYGVAAVSATDVWAVGYYYRFGCCHAGYETLIEHWDGSQWWQVTSPNPSTCNGGCVNRLYAVAAAATDDIWAVGDSGYDTARPLVVHWNGIQWSLSSIPDTNHSSYLRGVEVVSANDVWAVGASYNIGFSEQTLVAHWDGVQWSIVPTPNIDGVHNFLYGVRAAAPNDIWAIGYHYSESYWQTLTEHWDGVQWSIVPSPSSQMGNTILSGIAAIGDNDAWAVGYFNDGTSNQTLIERWHLIPCPTFTPTNTPTSTPTSTPTPVLIAHVTWQGRPPQPHALQQLPITLTLKSAVGESNFPIQSTDASGYFTNSLTGLPTGLYLWRVHGPKYLANSGTVAITGTWTTSVEMGLMKAGDCNDDNVVNSMDFTILKNTFGKSNGQPGYDGRADFNGDNVVNVVDASIQKSSFGQAGAPPIGPVGP